MCPLLANTGACRALAQEAIAGKLSEDQERVRTFEGTLSERGTAAPGDCLAEVVSRVRFAAPASVRIDVLAPDDWKGDVFAYDGSTLHVYSKHLDAELRIRHLAAPDAATRRALVSETVGFNLDNYGYREEEPETVSARVAIPWLVTPREPGDLRVRSRFWLDGDYSVPLRAILEKPEGGTLYEMRYLEATFNEAVAPEAFRFDPPETAARIDLDLAAAPITRAEAAARADFRLLEPSGEPVMGLALARIVKASSNVIPSVCLRYERAPFQATVLESKDRGPVDAKERGVPVDLAGSPARVLFVGSSTTIISFARDGVRATLWTNLPLAAAVRFARLLAPRPEPEGQ
jgi:outer membrane lipoprotein-sorting protein